MGPFGPHLYIISVKNPRQIFYESSCTGRLKKIGSRQLTEGNECVSGAVSVASRGSVEIYHRDLTPLATTTIHTRPPVNHTARDVLNGSHADVQAYYLRSRSHAG